MIKCIDCKKEFVGMEGKEDTCPSCLKSVLQVNKKITIPFSEEDLQELLNGESFDWTFDGVDVHLFMGCEHDNTEMNHDGSFCLDCGEEL